MRSRSLLALACTLAVGHAVPALAEGPIEVGAASRSIAPPDQSYATHVGGYGSCQGCPTTEVEPGDDITTRAMAVRRGTDAVVMVKADLEGWFAGYKDGAGLGLNDLRAEAASDLGIKAQDIIVQSAHCHACPSVVGIWGPTNDRYLHFVYEQTLAAIRAAWADARPARLRYASADLGYINDVTVGQLNANEGWPIDKQASVMQARDVHHPRRVIATYATVPAHANIVFGPQSHRMSSDYFGAAQRWIEAHDGGTAIVGPATLGDQTTPMQGDSSRTHVLGVIARLGALVGDTFEHALAEHGHAIPADGPIAGAETYTLLPATNPLLTASNCTDQGQQAVGIQIDRSCDPPYAVPGAMIGAWFTTLRLGPVAVVSEPGEAFPHVTYAIRQTLSGAKMVFTMGQAQDQLGYYYEAWAFPTTFVYSADHYLFHASMALPTANEQAEQANALTLGFSTTPATSTPGDIDLTRLTKPGVQAWAYPAPVGDDVDGLTVTVGVYRAGPRSQAIGVGSDAPDPTVDFGDGSPAVTQGSPAGASTCCIELTHTYPHPGDYTITATLPGTSEAWHSVAHVHSAHDVTNTPTYPTGF